MQFTREIYVAAKLIASFSGDEGLTHPMSEAAQKFYALRTLELYYRSVDGVLGRAAPQTQRDQLVAACFMMMHKFYDTAPMLSLEALYPYVSDIFPAGTLDDYRRRYKELELAVQKQVKWALVPPGMLRDGQDHRFLDLAAFGQGCVGPAPAAVEEALDAQERSLRLLYAAKRAASWFSCGGFFLRDSADVTGRLSSVHDGVVLLCREDGIFCNTVWAYCTERYAGRAPAYIEPQHLRAPASASTEAIRACMVAGLSQHMEAEIGRSLVQVQALHALVVYPPPDVQLSSYNDAKRRLDRALNYHTLCRNITSTLQAIHPGSLQACLRLSRDMDELLEDTGKFLEVRLAELPAGEEFKTTSLRRGVLICTRVSADPFQTPGPRRHSVEVIPGAVKVVVKTRLSAPYGGKSKVIRVEVKPSFATACDRIAAAYSARSAAADAAIAAAQASEEADSACAAERSACAAAAMAAAEEEAEAELAAEEAEEAAREAVREAEADAAARAWADAAFDMA